MKSGLSSLIASSAAGFEQPFEMLSACHERVTRTLTLLQRLRVHLREHGADAQAQQAARDVMRYFNLAAPAHHRDEELHVFPVLLAQGDANVVAVVRRLQDEHVQMEKNWQAARAVLQNIESASLACLVAADEAVLDAFAQLYDGHIEAEERVAYPAAQAQMSAAQLQAMGQEMGRRRGVR